MNGINIAKAIINKRKEKRITQDDLANFIGVSKSSVSKWETGQSYPDIVYLPQLAAYFNISLDELMGYEPQMTDGDINKLYKELSREFAEKPFDEVMARCREIVKKYFSCFPLLYRMALLYVNYGASAESPKIEVIAEAKELFIRVKEQSNHLELKQLALSLEATCEILLGRPDEVIELLADIKSPPPHEGLLARAYMMAGKPKEAKAIFQKMIYYNIHILVRILPAYLAVCADDRPRFEEIYKRTSSLIDTFNLKEVDPTFILPFYLAAAQAYAATGEAEKSLLSLEAYTDVVVGLTYPLEYLKGDDFFDSIKSHEGELTFGQAEMPKDENSLRKCMADDVIKNPAFFVLADEPRFKKLVKKLKTI
jgi:transcriptional regulator with XRE-family HTH domain